MVDDARLALRPRRLAVHAGTGRPPRRADQGGLTCRLFVLRERANGITSNPSTAIADIIAHASLVLAAKAACSIAARAVDRSAGIRSSPIACAAATSPAAKRWRIASI